MSLLLLAVDEHLHRILEMPDVDPEAKRSLNETWNRGIQVREWTLDHVHGLASPRLTPNLLELKRMIDEFEKFAVSLTRL